MEVLKIRIFSLVVRPFGSLSKVYFYVHLRLGKGLSQRDCCLFFILVFSYPKIIKLLGSNKSKYGSDYRAQSSMTLPILAPSLRSGDS